MRRLIFFILSVQTLLAQNVTECIRGYWQGDERITPPWSILKTNFYVYSFSKSITIYSKLNTLYLEKYYIQNRTFESNSIERINFDTLNPLIDSRTKERLYFTTRQLLRIENNKFIKGIESRFDTQNNFSCEDSILTLSYDIYKRIKVLPQKVIDIIKRANLLTKDTDFRDFDIYPLLKEGVKKVKTEKAFFYDDNQARKKSYLVKGDLVEIVVTKPAFYKAKYYTNEKVFEGWMRKEDLE